MGESLKDNRPLDLNSLHDDTVIQSLLERAAGGGTLMVRAFGVSMHPFIRNGEIIAIRAVPVEQLRPGDVIFFHHKNRLYAHRLIRKQKNADTGVEGNDEGDFLLITKGDSLRYADAPIAPSQVIGKVVAVYRGGDLISMSSARQRLMGRLISRISFLYGSLFDLAVTFRGRLVTRLVRYHFFRKLRKRVSHASLEYRPFQPDDLKGFAKLLADGSPTVSFDELLGLAQEQVNQIAERGGTLYVAMRGQDLVGAFQGGKGLLMKEFGIPGWWIMGLYVRSTQRGLGIAEGLTRALIEHAESEGAEAVYCNVFVNNIASTRLFQKLGFVRAEEVEEELNRGYQKISRELPYTLALKYVIRK